MFARCNCSGSHQGTKTRPPRLRRSQWRAGTKNRPAPHRPRLHGRGKMPRVRYTNNIIGRYTFSWLIGQPVEDSQCGFRLYDREVMENIHILNDGFEAGADILLRGGKRGYRIGFVPIKTIYFSNPQHRSYYHPIKDTFRISIIFLMNLFWKNR